MNFGIHRNQTSVRKHTLRDSLGTHDRSRPLCLVCPATETVGLDSAPSSMESPRFALLPLFQQIGCPLGWIYLLEWSHLTAWDAGRWSVPQHPTRIPTTPNVIFLLLLAARMTFGHFADRMVTMSSGHVFPSIVACSKGDSNERY